MTFLFNKIIAQKKKLEVGILNYITHPSNFEGSLIGLPEVYVFRAIDVNYIKY